MHVCTYASLNIVTDLPTSTQWLSSDHTTTIMLIESHTQQMCTYAHDISLVYESKEQ